MVGKHTSVHLDLSLPTKRSEVRNTSHHPGPAHAEWKGWLPRPLAVAKGQWDVQTDGVLGSENSEVSSQVCWKMWEFP